MQLPEKTQPGSEAWVTNEKLMQLEAALLARDAKLPGHLAAMHAHLEQFPEMLHLLDPADFGKIIAAHMSYTNTEIGASKVKAVGKKPPSKIGVSDII